VVASTGRSLPVMYDSANLPPPLYEELIEAFRYRELIAQLIIRDIRVRYKRSVLGIGWSMLNPLLMMIIFTAVFSSLFRFDIPYYSVYILSGTLLWNLFSQGTTIGVHQLLSSGPLVTRIYVPKTIFALAATGSSLINTLLALAPLAIIMLVMGAPLRPSIVWLLPALLLTALFTIGVGLLVSSLAVSFHDVAEVYQVLLSAWYFLTPVFYPLSIIPENSRWWFQLNPMYALLEVFRAPLLDGSAAPLPTWLAAGCASIGLLIVGWLVFARRAHEIPYRL
jgi:lipopolysaccharide transport system permease protein